MDGLGRDAVVERGVLADMTSGKTGDAASAAAREETHERSNHRANTVVHVDD
jgi:hypothetical protein